MIAHTPGLPVEESVLPLAPGSSHRRGGRDRGSQAPGRARRRLRHRSSNGEISSTDSQQSASADAPTRFERRRTASCSQAAGLDVPSDVMSTASTKQVRMFEDPHCRDCRSACSRPDPRRLASAPGCRSRRGAATRVDTHVAAEMDELEERAPDGGGHLLLQVKEQCPPTETTLLLSIERRHAVRAAA